ncbi:MAG TPA: 4'-phosphopantetheinyl transferase superfamily protein [Puia sp.]|nr:4'-phosphopantetheinyl transferase superfamily protein [Puia sp.]
MINRSGHILSEDEKARASHYRKPNDKQRFEVSRIALRFLLGKYANNEPENIEFVIGLNKKPFVQNLNARDLYYNVAHSADEILIAVSDADIGIDVERIDLDFAYSEILGQNFSLDEIGFINGATLPAESFYLLWTRKEALLKATSKGIDEDLPLVPSLDGTHTVDQKIIGSDKDFSLDSFRFAKNYVGSIAYPTGCENIRFIDINRFIFPR